MILVTVGGQVAFDRLVKTVDAWAEEAGREDLFFQILDGSYTPTHGTWQRKVDPIEFEARLAEADAIVSHAGMGTTLRALALSKPLLVMPRRAALGEQRNDHQLATARRLAESGRAHVAMDECELAERLRDIDSLEPLGTIGARASESLLRAIREFANGGAA